MFELVSSMHPWKCKTQICRHVVEPGTVWPLHLHWKYVLGHMRLRPLRHLAVLSVQIFSIVILLLQGPDLFSHWITYNPLLLHLQTHWNYLTARSGLFKHVERGLMDVLHSSYVFFNFFAVCEGLLKGKKKKKTKPRVRVESRSGCTSVNYPNKAPPFPFHECPSWVRASPTSSLTITVGASGIFSAFPDFLVGEEQTLSGFGVTSRTLFLAFRSFFSWSVFVGIA